MGVIHKLHANINHAQKRKDLSDTIFLRLVAVASVCGARMCVLIILTSAHGGIFRAVCVLTPYMNN